MQSQYEIHNLKIDKTQIEAVNIELEMQLRNALEEIENLKTVINCHETTIKNVA